MNKRSRLMFNWGILTTYGVVLLYLELQAVTEKYATHGWLLSIAIFVWITGDKRLSSGRKTFWALICIASWIADAYATSLASGAFVGHNSGLLANYLFVYVSFITIVLCCIFFAPVPYEQTELTSSSLTVYRALLVVTGVAPCLIFLITWFDLVPNAGSGSLTALNQLRFSTFLMFGAAYLALLIKTLFPDTVLALRHADTQA